MLGYYLMFNRNCEEALKVYEKAFHTKVTMIQKYKDLPPNPYFPVSEGDMELVLHSRLVIDGSEIMCADSSHVPISGSNMYITITSSDEDMINQAWITLKEGGKILLDLSPTFFAKLHGHLQDKFGVNWMFTLE
ncbi:VOC family protein [Anaeromicropila herbilytica]|uniref:VOC family protein n=1 Tax=Anaeromicropila herbilytica TaxID=2785025 RepID=A0A7R7IB79_9FIRM|nr:VOC family protein [Anaeromicropila herbilytica]BCN29283.1 VOC family protein [Anaeromicropila herbilytica]